MARGYRHGGAGGGSEKHEIRYQVITVNTSANASIKVIYIVDGVTIEDTTYVHSNIRNWTPVHDIAIQYDGSKFHVKSIDYNTLKEGNNTYTYGQEIRAWSYQTSVFIDLMEIQN